MAAEAPLSGRRHPLESSGPLTRALLLWLFPLLLQGRRCPLTEEDVWPLPSWVHSDSAAARVQEAWSSREPGAAGQGLPVSLLAVVRGTFGRHAGGVVAAAVYSTVAYQLPPLFLGELFRRLLAADGAARPPLLESGWPWALLVFAAAAMVALGPSSAQRTQVALGIEVRNSLLCSIYGALLRLRPERCVQLGRHGLSALCTTLAGVDCDRVYMLCHFGCFVLLDFLLVGACMPMLVQISGPVGLWGCAVLALGALVQKAFMDRVVAARAAMQRHTDRRLAFTQELFENIRSVKMCSLAQGLRMRIEAEREMELRAQWSVFMMRSLNGAITYALVPWALLAILVAGTRGEGGSLSAASVFAALAFLNTNRIVFSVLPFELNTVSEGLTSLARIGRLLGSNAACRKESGGGCGSAFPPFPAEASSGAAPAGLAVREAEYSWKAPGTVAAEGRAEGHGQHFERLSVSELELPAGCLAVVVGPSGGGKSSLCCALAAWMPQVRGARSCFQGKVAFCPQEPWVLSGTIAENVAGPGQARSVAEVWRCLQSARLDADVGNFPGKLETEIGYRGITLSGGQKARLGLARALALRREAEAFILDDVLSALDGAAAEWIAEKTILDELKGTTRVVVLNSHYELLLPHADVVVLVENGTATVYQSTEDFSSSGFAKSLAAHEESKAPSEVRQCPEWILAGLPRGLTAEELADDADAGKRDAPEDGGALFEPEFRARGPLDPWLYATYIGFGARSERSGRAGPALLLAFLALAVLLPDAVRLVSEFLLSASLKDGIDLADQSWLWQFAMFTLATFALALLRPLAFTMLAHRSSRRLHQRLLHRLCEAPVTTFFDVVPPGRLMNLCGKDLDAVDTLIPSAALDFLQDLSILGSTVLVSAAVIPPVLLILLPAGWVLLRLRRLLMCSARELVRMEACSRSPALAMLAETVAGLPVIRSQGAEAAMYGRFCTLANKNSSFFVHSWYLMPWLSLWLDELVAFFVLAACCSALLLRSSISPSLLVVALTNNISLLSKVQITCRLSAEVEKLFTSVERLAHALRCTPQEEGELVAPQSVAADWPETGSVSFEAVSLRYRPGLPLVLAELSFNVAGGESVGLIGASGCGKSTCLRVVLRMAALAGGRVRIDGVDTARLPLALLRSRVAVVPQEPLVLSGSVRRNLGAAAEEDCWAMLGLLGLSKLVNEAPKGLDMELASGAESVLSLGQRQLLSLGRALLHPSRLLCIDEATANVDGATDAALQRAMASDALGGGARTRLIVAHRLWTLRHCHEVLVLQPGPPTSVHRIRNPGSNTAKVSL